MMSIFCQTYCDVSGTLSYIRIRTWVLFIQTQVWGYNIYIYILQARFFYIVTHIVHRHGYCLFQDLDFLRQRRIVFVTRFAIVFVHARGIAEKKTEPISRLGWGLGGLTGGGDIAGRAASPSYPAQSAPKAESASPVSPGFPWAGRHPFIILGHRSTPVHACMQRQICWSLYY